MVNVTEKTVSIPTKNHIWCLIMVDDEPRMTRSNKNSVVPILDVKLRWLNVRGVSRAPRSPRFPAVSVGEPHVIRWGQPWSALRTTFLTLPPWIDLASWTFRCAWMRPRCGLADGGSVTSPGFEFEEKRRVLLMRDDHTAMVATGTIGWGVVIDDSGGIMWHWGLASRINSGKDGTCWWLRCWFSYWGVLVWHVFFRMMGFYGHLLLYHQQYQESTWLVWTSRCVPFLFMGFVCYCRLVTSN